MAHESRIGAFELFGTGAYLAILACWAGILPVWQLAPAPVRPALEVDLGQLLMPALAMGGAVVLVTLLRLAGALHGWTKRLAELVLQVAGIVFACLALRAVAPLSFAGYGPGWAIVDVCLHVGAVFALFVLPWVAVIAAVGGLFNLVRREWQAA
jgi:hypothetical protein